MIKIKETNNLFFTSDLHFNHSKIIEYCNRPFSDVEEMNETLISNWNNTVKPEDIIFCLGDITLGGSNVWNTLISRLNGKIHLILGNHDIRNWRESYNNLFESVSEQLTISVNNKTIILTHYPLLCYHGTWGTEQNCWNLMGHVHTLRSSNSGKDFERLQYLFPSQYDVGVDFNNYTPISFQEVKEKIDFQVKNNVNMLYWVKS